MNSHQKAPEYIKGKSPLFIALFIPSEAPRAKRLYNLAVREARAQSANHAWPAAKFDAP